LWSKGAIRSLVVCEEAHRYVPADPNLGFMPTRQAIARIAKEGRKYGTCLGVVTQRPGELDPTILSQCSTVFAMRLANDLDQEIIRSAIPDSSTSTTSFLSSMGNGEAIAFGEAIAVPMRMRFSRVPADRLPKANGALAGQTNGIENADLRAVVQHMRAISGQELAASAITPQPGDETYAQAATGIQPGERDPASRFQDRSVSQPDMPMRRHDDRPDLARSPVHRPLRDESASRPLDPLFEEERRRNAELTPSPIRRDPTIRASLLKKPIGSLLK
jgi:hypothetical protein